MLDEPPRLRDGAIITPTVAKSIFGQAVLQLGVMGLLLGPLGVALAEAGGDSAAARAAAAAVVGDHGLQYTLVFNSFVFMQLFNQVSDSEWERHVKQQQQQQRWFMVCVSHERCPCPPRRWLLPSSWQPVHS